MSVTLARRKQKKKNVSQVAAAEEQKRMSRLVRNRRSAKESRDCKQLYLQLLDQMVLDQMNLLDSNCISLIAKCNVLVAQMMPTLSKIRSLKNAAQHYDKTTSQNRPPKNIPQQDTARFDEALDFYSPQEQNLKNLLFNINATVTPPANSWTLSKSSPLRPYKTTSPLPQFYHSSSNCSLIKQT